MTSDLYAVYVIGFSFLFYTTSLNFGVMLWKMATVEAIFRTRLTQSFNFFRPPRPATRALTSTEFVSKDYRQNCIKCEWYALNLKENNCKLQLKRSSVQSFCKMVIEAIFCWESVNRFFVAEIVMASLRFRSFCLGRGSLSNSFWYGKRIEFWTTPPHMFCIKYFWFSWKKMINSWLCTLKLITFIYNLLLNKIFVTLLWKLQRQFKKSFLNTLVKTT
jgi:hypothetical protein